MTRCALSCAEGHTYRYQVCALAPEPEPTVSILRVEDAPDGGRHITTRSIPAKQWEALVKIAMWVSRGKTAAFVSDPNLFPAYPDAAARFALGALHDAGLLPLADESARTTPDNPTSSNTPIIDRPFRSHRTPKEPR